jgi:hypothetical protein
MRSKLLLKFLLINIGLLFAIHLHAQKLSVEVKTIHVSENSAGNGQIEVIINNGSPNYSFYLFNSATGIEGKPIASEKGTISNSYTFLNIKKGEYLIIVNDNRDIPKAVKATVE